MLLLIEQTLLNPRELNILTLGYDDLSSDTEYCPSGKNLFWESCLILMMCLVFRF